MPGLPRPARGALRMPAVMVAGLVLAAAAAADDPLLVTSRELSASFGAELKSALQAAMADGGPTEAIGVCSELAPRIASRLSRHSGARLGRTSLNIRNPRNLPTDWQVAVLRDFDAAAAADGPQPAEYFGRAENGDVRYMRAIPTDGLCTACHGTRLSAEVRAVLDEHYPHDRARGYEVGDIRGAFTVVWPAAIVPR